MESLPQDSLRDILAFLNVRSLQSISLVSKAFAPLFWRSLRSLSRRHATLPRPGDRFPPRSDPTDARYAGYGLVPVTEATNSAYETVENLWWTYHFWAWDLARFTRLRRLHIELVFMPVEMRARLVDALPLFTSLHTLSISNDVRFGSKWALNINGLHNLRVLDLSRCNSTDEFQLLMNNLQHPSLQILYPRHGDYDSGQFKSRLPSLKLIVQNSLSSEIIAIGNSYNGWDLDAYISHWKDWDTEVSISRSSTFSESCPDKRATPLQTACQLENRQAVLRLLTTNSYKHMDVNYIDPATNRSVLGYCCHYCWLDILEVLLLNRASTGLSNTINTIFADGHTALSLASEASFDIGINLLLGAGAKVQPASFARNAFITSNASLDANSELFEHNEGMKAWWDPYAAETVLCAACRRGEAVIVEQILRHINELPSSRATQLANATDGLLRSPLHLACIAGSQEVIELLLASPYTDLNKLDMKNRSALSYLLEGNPMDNFLSVELLLEQPKLVLTAEDPWLDSMTVWSSHGFDNAFMRLVAIKQPEGSVAADLFSNAARAAKEFPDAAHAMIDALIDGGCNVNALTSEGVPILVAALSAAAFDEDSALGLAQSLVNRGSTVNCRAPDGRTPLTVAVDQSWHTVVAYLIKQGAQINSVSPNRPLLHQACKSENYAIAKLLLDKGVDVNYMTPDGRTALLMVLLNRNTVKESIKISMTTLLLKYKADPRKGSPPPLIAAVISQAPKVVKLLLDQKGVDVNCQDDSGRTPLSQAHIQRSANLGDLVNVLLPAYPDVNLSPKEPFEPIFHIVATRNVGWVQQVMGMHKFDVNVRNYRGETILHVLCRQRTDVDNTVVRVVLGHPHLDFSAQDSNGDTALHHFACDAHFYPIQNEIAARSRIDIPNNLGITVRLLPQAKLEKIQQLQNEYNMRRQSVQ